MSTGLEAVRPLDEDILRFFAERDINPHWTIDGKDTRGAPSIRRMMQLTRDFATRPFPELRILDLGCHRGAYAIEAALRGAEVLALDYRTARMNQGMEIARGLGLDRLRFEQGDVRHVTKERYGMFDVVYFLGLLYHLDAPDIFSVVENIRDLTREFVIIDTHFQSGTMTEVEHRGRRYAVHRWREHGDDDPESVQLDRVSFSVGNVFALSVPRDSLVRMLVDVGFTSVVQCHAPLRPGNEDRFTLIARRGTRVQLSIHPWLNDQSEDEIASLADAADRSIAAPAAPAAASHRGWRRRFLEATLRRPLGWLGYELNRKE